MQFILS